VTTHRLNIILAILGSIAGIFILAIIHAHNSPRPTESNHWIAPDTDRTGEIQRQAGKKM
jgi:hypothetical protein